MATAAIPRNAMSAERCLASILGLANTLIENRAMDLVAPENLPKLGEVALSLNRPTHTENPSINQTKLSSGGLPQFIYTDIS